MSIFGSLFYRFLIGFFTDFQTCFYEIFLIENNPFFLSFFLPLFILYKHPQNYRFFDQKNTSQIFLCEVIFYCFLVLGFACRLVLMTGFFALGTVVLCVIIAEDDRSLFHVLTFLLMADMLYMSYVEVGSFWLYLFVQTDFCICILEGRVLSFLRVYYM